MTTIERYCNENNLEAVSFVKIDTEGSEFAVLKGAESIIKAGEIDAIQIEINAMNVMSRTFIYDFYKLMPHFTFYRLHRDGLIPLGPYRPQHEIFLFHNLLAVRAPLAERLPAERLLWSRRQ